MKNGASGFVKQILSGLHSKTASLKSKASAIKARLIVFSLLRNKKFFITSFSEKLHSLLGHHNHSSNGECLLEDAAGNDDDVVVFSDSKAIVAYNQNDAVTHCYSYEEEEGNEDVEDKYPDLTHTLFETEDVAFEGSVIDMVKNSKEEAGEEFKLEDEIDHVADLFIRKFRRQIVLQKQESLKRMMMMLNE